MRAKSNPQRSIFEVYSDHSIGQELKTISDCLDALPECLDWVAEDLKRNRKVRKTGRRGMSAESVLRTAIVMQQSRFTYRELSFHLGDSLSFQAFCRTEGWAPDFSTLQKLISSISADTWERINVALIGKAAKQRIEMGRTVRTDSTVTETHIHEPSDSSLLFDGVRVMTRLLCKGATILGAPRGIFRDRTRVCKKTARKIQYCSRNKARVPLYKKLLKETKGCISDLVYMFEALTERRADLPSAGDWLSECTHYLTLIQMVMFQTEQRVLFGNSVPPHQKVVSLFEDHTDIIIKGKRDVTFGHKVNLTSGRSGMILDFVVEQGNPADSIRAIPMIERQIKVFGRPPRQASFDGCYASKENVKRAKDLGVKDIAFHKKRGLEIADMAKSNWVYQKLRAFRAGIEGNIATLKAKFGFRRCNWRGFERFKACLWGSVVAYNLVLYARHQLNEA